VVLNRWGNPQSETLDSSPLVSLGAGPFEKWGGGGGGGGTKERKYRAGKQTKIPFQQPSLIKAQGTKRGTKTSTCPEINSYWKTCHHVDR
jgi:hypothetical protein